jgi:hypothetical protein
VIILRSALQLGRQLILRNVPDLPIVHGVELLDVAHGSCRPTSIEATIASLVMHLIVVLVGTLAVHSCRIYRGLVAHLLVLAASRRMASLKLLLLSDLVMVFAL